MRIERARELAVLVRQRLRANPRQSVMFALLGTTMAELADLANWPEQLERHGAALFAGRLLREWLIAAVAAMVVAFALRACTDHGASLLRRPARFLFVLTGATAGATLCAWWLVELTGTHSRPAIEQLVHFWLQAMLWGGLTGWLYLLSMQRTEYQRHVDALLGRRMLLARQLANARTGAARATVDPAMVARVLSEVQRRYVASPDSAAGLLDQLIAYLRLAMNRARSTDGQLSGDIALLRALLAVRAEELSIRVRLELPAGGAHLYDGAVFATAASQLEDAIAAGTSDIVVTLVAHAAPNNMKETSHVVCQVARTSGT